MKRIINSLNIAVGQILNNKVRSLLSVFAVSIGVLVFLFVFSALNYAKNVKAKQLAVAGENVFDIDITSDPSNFRLNMNNFVEIEQKFPELKFIAPRGNIFSTHDVLFNNRYYNTNIVGITPNHKEFDWVYTNLKGRFISWDDINNRRKVAVFVRSPLKNKDKTHSNVSWGYGRWGYHESIDWSDKQDIVGQTINVMGDTYTVVGSLDLPLYYEDNRVEKIYPNFMLPITSAANTFWGERYFSYITAAVYDEKLFPSVKKRLELYIRNQAKDKTKALFAITTYKDKIAYELKSTEENIKLISILGLIALISGGIGIMNVILATIFARIKEIGTRRALGASRTDIFMQFSAESVILSLLGAFLGLILSHFLFDKLGSIIKLQTEFNWLAVVLAFGMAMITGFIFSLYPALKAANMDPVEALKIE